MTDECAPRWRFHQPALGIWGKVCMLGVVGATIAIDPQPGLHGDGPWIGLALIAFVAGIAVALRPLDQPAPRRIAALLLVTAASCTLAALQTHGPGIAGIYFVVVIAGIGLDRIPGAIVATTAVGAALVVLSFGPDAPDQTIGLILSAVPWFFVMRLVRELRLGRERAERLVAELEESRAAEADAAAAAERGRVARDMHDVLAHSLSALAIQLEGARLLTRNRGADPEIVAAVERAHHLAAGGLAEARQAIGALHGDELPGPERLPALVEGFAEHSHVDARLTVTGEPGPQSSEARLALYRTAQEALTNIRKHSAADRVDVRLEYESDGTRLTVRDHGVGAPIMVGAETARANGGGYGLTGMRERAELLGGTLSAEPTADGFCVELWLPA